MSEIEQSKGYEFTILSEDVAIQDLFEDKTHERVSQNLFQVITQSNKGVTIGLEGSWGSGKSTVIKLLRDKLKERDPKSLFFMFDAWAHDGDPLRRIFLESLIRNIDPDGNNSRLDEINSRITGRKKTVEVRAKKSTSRLGKLISLSALAIPLGTAILNKVKFENLVSPWSPFAHFYPTSLIVGLFFCLAPIWILVYWFCCGDKDHATQRVTWEFFSTDSKEDYTQDISEDGERTSIEFEDYFQQIIQCAIEDESIRKCVIVIDNLDRIDPEHAKNIWSTLQTFFQKRSNNTGKSNWSDKMWFVIPFDQQGFVKIWSSSESVDDVAKSFLKKCFQLIAEVPPPVMSGWSEYARSCIESALTGWPKGDLEQVLTNYIRYAGKLETSPTPRDIKAFINQLGLIGAMWGGSVSVESLCLYVLLKESNTVESIRKTLVSGALPGNFQTNNDRNLICSEIAGLLFGVQKEKGLQLLLGPEIKEAFSTGNGDLLRGLVKSYGHAFWIAYEASKSLWLISSTDADEYKIAFTKAFYDGLSSYQNKVFNDSKNLTHIWLESMERLNFARFDYSASLEVCLKLSQEPEKILKLIRAFVEKRLGEIISELEEPEFPEDSLENFLHLIKLVEMQSGALPRREYPIMTLQKWELWLMHMNNYDLKFSMVIPNIEVIRSIEKMVQFSSNTYDEKKLKVLSLTYDYYPDAPVWESVITQAISWFNFGERTVDCETLYAFCLKFFGNNSYKLSEKIEACVKSPSFWVASRHSAINKNPSLPILASISLNNDLQKKDYVSNEIKSFWAATPNDNDIAATYEQLKRLKKVDTIWQLCRDKKNVLAIEIVRNITDTALFSSATGAFFIDEYSWATEVEIASFAQKFAQHGAFLANSKVMSENAVAFQGVFSIFYALHEAVICDFIDDKISKLNKENWQEILANNGKMLELVKGKNPFFSDAIQEYLIDLVSGKLPEDTQTDLIPNLPGLLGKVTDLDKTILPKIINLYFSDEEDPLDDIQFKVLSPFFNKHLSCVDEKLLMTRIIEWINNDEIARVRWLADQEIKLFEEPLEKLIALVEHGLKSEVEIKRTIAAKINQKFKLGLLVASQQA